MDTPDRLDIDPYDSRDETEDERRRPAVVPRDDS